MVFLGRINRRKIYYLSIRNNLKWKSLLPNRDWLAFTVSNHRDEERISKVVDVCLNKHVSYVCNVGEARKMAELYFDDEIAWRAFHYETEYKKPFDFNFAPLITAHDTLEEGFWFASTLANDDYFGIEKVVCVDFTDSQVKNTLIRLIEKINHGWIPD